MIIDTSAIIAILRTEPEAASCARAIADATDRRISAVNFVETAVVIDASRDPIATRRFDDFIKEANIIVEPVTKFQAQIARDAYRDFGKASRHPAKLNFGDCFAYALTKAYGEPLLFKGADFVHTDIVSALPRSELDLESGMVELLALAGVHANLVPDAHLAALALEHGYTPCSMDEDFARFTSLRWPNSLAS